MNYLPTMLLIKIATMQIKIPTIRFSELYRPK